jgi:hypothetical protein
VSTVAELWRLTGNLWKEGEGRKEGSKEGRKQGRKEGRKEGGNKKGAQMETSWIMYA